MALSNKIGLSFPLKPPISMRAEKSNRPKSVEELKRRLWELADEEVNNDVMIRFKYDSTEHRELMGSSLEIYCNPVLMAIGMGEYGLARVLLDKGYKAGTDKTQCFTCMDFLDVDEVEVEAEWAKVIHLTQLIMINPSIPDDIVKRILEELYENRKEKDNILDFRRDVSNNPFIRSGKERLEDYKTSIDSIAKIKDMDKKYIKGMLKNYETAIFPTRNEDGVELYRKLILMFEYDEDVINVIREEMFGLFKEELSYSDEDGSVVDDYILSDFGQKLVPIIKTICQQNDRIGKQVAMLYFDNFRNIRKARNARKKKLIRRYILPICGDLEFDEIAAKNLDELNMGKVFDYIISWKETFGGKIVWKRYNKNYISLMLKGITGVGVFGTEGTMEILRFFICIDEIDKGKENEEDKDSLKQEEKIINKLLEYGNEEIIMLMLEKGYYSDKLIDMFIAKCLNRKNIRLVPMLIYYREKEKE